MIKLIMLGLGFAWPFLLKVFWWAVATLGVGFITYEVVQTGLEWLITQLVSYKSNLEAVGYNGLYAGAIARFAQAFGVDLILAGIAAGYTSRVALQGVSTLKRLVFKS